MTTPIAPSSKTLVIVNGNRKMNIPVRTLVRLTSFEFHREFGCKVAVFETTGGRKIRLYTQAANIPESGIVRFHNGDPTQGIRVQF